MHINPTAIEAGYLRTTRTNVSRITQGACVALVGMLCLPARNCVHAEDPPLVPTQELGTRVNRAIDVGSTWLHVRALRERWFSDVAQSRKLTLKDPEWFGPRVLAALALVHASDGRAASKLAGILEFVGTCGSRSIGTYGSGLALLVLQALDEQSKRGQSLGWKPDWLAPRTLTDRERQAAEEYFDALLSGVRDGSLWSYRGPAPAVDCDASNVQFATMGSLAATRLGLVVPKRLELPVMKELLRWSDAGGAPSRFVAVAAGGSGVAPIMPLAQDALACPRGAPYRIGHPLIDGTSTASIVVGLLAWRGAISGAPRSAATSDSAVADAVRDGMAWFFGQFDAELPPLRVPRGASPMRSAAQSEIGYAYRAYYLWAVERMCTLAGVQTVSGKDWYRMGAEALLRMQRPDGSWRLGPSEDESVASEFGSSAGPNQDVLDTSFALLFLTRSGRCLLRPETTSEVTTPKEPATTPR